MTDEPNDRDDEREEDDPTGVPATDEGPTDQDDPNWSTEDAQNSVLADSRDMIRRALSDVSGLTKFNVAAEFFPKINIFESAYPTIDLPSLLWKPDIFGLFPLPETSGFMPRFDFTDLTLTINSAWAKNFGSIVDLAAFIPKITIPDFSDSFKAMLELLREKLPPNWPEGIDFDAVTAVIQDDGLPLVWVPRVEIVEEVLAAPDREARVKILLARSNEVMQDCRDVLATVDHHTLVNQLPLVERVVDAFHHGHVESAQALAVLVTETVVARTLGKNYKKVQELVQFDREKVTLEQVRVKAALAPIGLFYTAWWPSSGIPAPTALSRHVAVHQADLGHYTPGNAIVAVMLATSVLRAMQEYLES